MNKIGLTFVFEEENTDGNTEKYLVPNLTVSEMLCGSASSGARNSKAGISTGCSTACLKVDFMVPPYTGNSNVQ